MYILYLYVLRVFLIKKRAKRLQTNKVVLRTTIGSLMPFFIVICSLSIPIVQNISLEASITLQNTLHTSKPFRVEPFLGQKNYNIKI